MEPNYEYRFDKNGLPIAVISAFGKTLSEDLPLDKMVTINETVSDAAATFVDDCRNANKKLRKAEPTNAGEKEYAQAFLAYHLHIHQQETGERVTFVTPGKISEHWEAKENGEEVFHGNEIYSKVAASIVNIDAILILKDNTVVPAIDLLIKFCNKHRIPIMATELDSVDKGTSFGFGVHEFDYGANGAKLARQILVEGKKPGQIPCHLMNEHVLKVNIPALSKQGVSINDIQGFMLSRCEVVETT